MLVREVESLIRSGGSAPAGLADEHGPAAYLESCRREPHRAPVPPITLMRRLTAHPVEGEARGKSQAQQEGSPSNSREELRALALINLGEAEAWAARFEEASDLEHGVALARRIRRPYLEFTGLAHQAAAEINRSFARAAERGRQAVELAERHGWTDDPASGVAYMILGACWPGRVGWKRRSPGSSARSAPSARSRPAAACGSATSGGRSSRRGTGRRSAGRLPGRRAAGRAARRTALPRPAGAGTVARPWCASARPSAPSRPSPTSATRTATAETCACGARSVMSQCLRGIVVRAANPGLP